MVGSILRLEPVSREISTSRDGWTGGSEDTGSFVDEYPGSGRPCVDENL